jgi:hypothetical protein
MKVAIVLTLCLLAFTNADDATTTTATSTDPICTLTGIAPTDVNT